MVVRSILGGIMHNRLASRNADLTGRTPSLQTALRILIALALAMLSLPFLSTSASAAPIVGGFDIDGAPDGPPTATDGTVPSELIFTSSKENDAPTTWSLRMGKADDGGDITGVYTDDNIDTTGDVWFYFGFARAELGTGAFVVELNQNPNVPVLDSEDPLLNLTVPDRSVGDVRITFNQPDGNTNLQDVGADKWTGTAWADAPGFAYTSATNALGLFGEMAVNLTDSGLLPVCGNDFTAVNVRSRASSQEAAELKDYVKALGVSIRDERCRSIRVEKYDAETHAALSGASFRLFKDDGDGLFDFGSTQTGPSADAAVGGAVPADVGGNSYTWNDLAWGLYFVQETDRPTGYEVDGATNAQSVKGATLGLNTPNGTEVVTFNNPQKKAQIRVEKYDAITRAALSGAKFTLYKDDGDDTFEPTGVDSDTLIGAKVNADQGTNDNEYTWTTKLAYGKYFVEESGLPAGYDADAEPGTTNGVRTLVLDPSEAGTIQWVKFYNPPEGTPVVTSTITVTKTDVETNQQVDGARFVLRRSGVVVSTPFAHTAGTGVYTWSGLSTGDYTVTEAAAPDGYLAPDADTLPADDVESVIINAENAGRTFEVGFQNQKKPVIITPPPDPEVRTAIEVTKRDSTTNQPIDTATFQLWEDANANGTFEANKDDAISPAKDTVNGVVSWVGLLMGTYFVEETAAPSGYDLPANTVLTILVDANNAGGTLERSFYDLQKRTTIELVKRDDDTNQVLAGAGFQAYVDVNEDGEFDGGDTPIGGPKTSDANGVVSWSGLEFGHYVIREVAAPDNYGLATDSEQAVVLGQDNAGGTVQLVFLDPAQGVVSIVKVALEKDAAGRWVPSDGETAFGDLVKYRITANAYGAKMYRDVHVSDFIPGYDPADTKSTTKVSYVPGSATCGLAATCPVTFQADEQELTWSLGDMQAVERTLRFVVRMPALPVAPVYEDGVLIETVVNVAELSWQADAPESTQRLAGAYGNRSIRSNEVITTIVDQPKVLDTPPAERPETVKRPGALLPDTGAPTHSVLFGTVGSLSLLLGAWLMLVSRGRGYLPRR